MIPITCDNCKLRFICKIRESFEKPLLDTRHCIERHNYPDLCGNFYSLLGNFCTLFQMEDEEYYGNDEESKGMI